MHVTVKQYQIPGADNKPMLTDVFFCSNGNPKPVILFVHGFKGFKDWGHFNLLGKLFAEAGFVFVKFNFSHNGTTPEKPLEFSDLEAFGNNNYVKELHDLETVINYITQTTDPSAEANINEFYLLGHSRGGGISIIKAAENIKIKKLVTWASVSDLLNRNSSATIKEWKDKGVVYAYNARTKQNMPLYLQFYEAIEANKERLDIKKCAHGLQIPYLVIHGTNDEAVPFKEAEALNNFCPSAKLLKIPEANHTFGVSHPFTGNQLPEHAKLVVNETIRFFNSD